MAWVAILHPHPPPSASGTSFFCLILLSYLTSGVFSGCKLSLLKQHIFLNLTQPLATWLLAAVQPKKHLPRHIYNVFNYFLEEFSAGILNNLWGQEQSRNRIVVPATRPHSLAKLVPWNRFLGSLKVGLC
jgi:hypothetical protein